MDQVEINFCKEAKNCSHLYLFCLFDVPFATDSRDMIVDSAEEHCSLIATNTCIRFVFICCSVPERVFQGTKSASTRRLYLTDGMIPKYTGYVPRKSALLIFSKLNLVQCRFGNIFAY